MDNPMPAEVTRSVAAYVAQARYEDLPPDVRHETKRALLNIVGCALGGVSHEMIGIMARTLGGFSGQAQATVIGRDYRTDVLSAALLNGASSSARAFDDTHADAMVHPSGPPAMAALALGEWRGCSGRDLLLAVALGIEFTCRFSIALSAPPAIADMGWSQTGVTGGIGAAIAAGRLSGLDETGLRNAIGIAANLAGGIRAAIGTMSNPFLAAQGAQTGLRSVLMAEGGFTGPVTGLEHPFGYLNLFARAPNAAALTEELGSRFTLLGNAYKCYPCGVVMQAMLDGCLGLAREDNIAADDVVAIDIEASPETLKLSNNRHPKDHLEGQVSTHHWASVAFIRRTALIRDGSDMSVMDPEITAFRERVTLTADPALSMNSARVAVRLKDGTIRKRFVEHYSGSPANPMSDAALEEKFAGQAADLLPSDDLRALMNRLWNIERCADIGEVLAACGRGASPA